MCIRGRPGLTRWNVCQTAIAPMAMCSLTIKRGEELGAFWRGLIRERRTIDASM